MQRIQKIMEETQTTWEAPNLGQTRVQMEGDSVTRWITGVWKAYKKETRERIARLQDTLGELAKEWGASTPTAQDEPIKHVYRQWNTRADALATQAKGGNTHGRG